MIDTGAAYHVCPNSDWFSSFEKLDGCSVVMGDDHPCHMEGICTILVKMWDGAGIEGCEVCASTKKKSYLCWCLKSIGS